MAYARGLLALIPERLSFGLVHRRGIYGRVPHDVAVAFLDAVESRWTANSAATSPWTRRADAATWLARLWVRPVPPPRGPRVYLQASPHHLDRPTWVARAIRRERARWLVLAHDLIPITHPEYAMPEDVARHASRLRTMRSQATAILTNSAATSEALRKYWSPRPSSPPIYAIPLGTSPLATVPVLHSSERPYFLCVGTIEPRKNHLLLLNLWRELAAQHFDAVPRLVIAGRWGWKSANVRDMVERCRAIEDVVENVGPVGDQELAMLLARSRALLIPSFAEGYGLPLAEALAAGVPVLSSDLPALREAGGEVPEYFNPLDGPAWRMAVLDYAASTSLRRAAQKERLRSWTPVTWQHHLAQVLAVADSL